MSRSRAGLDWPSADAETATRATSELRSDMWLPPWLPSKDLFHYLAGHVGQALVPAAVAEGQALVVQAEQVQDGGVEVVDAHLPLDRPHAELVGRPDGPA